MIDQTKFQSLIAAYPFLGTLDPKVRALIPGEIEPDEEVVTAESVVISGKPGAIILTNRRVLAFWKLKMLVLFSFPAYQEFHRQQLKIVEPNGSTLRLRAETDNATEDDGWEDNTFKFASEEACSKFVSVLTSGTA